jgi:hypothetical protein
MKVNTILPDKDMSEVHSASGGKSITESPNIALSKFRKMNEELNQNPAQFQTGYSAEKLEFKN